MIAGFNTQPPEGGWDTATQLSANDTVSTHSRLKAAGHYGRRATQRLESFNTQPPEGGWRIRPAMPRCMTCFNTQPPEGGWGIPLPFEAEIDIVSTHSRLKAAG